MLKTMPDSRFKVTAIEQEAEVLLPILFFKNLSSISTGTSYMLLQNEADTPVSLR